MTSLEKLIKGLQPDESIVIFSEISRKYLSFFTSSDGVLLICADKCILYLDPRYEEAAKISKKNGIIPADIEIKPYVFIKDFAEMPEIRKVYFEDRKITVSELETLKKRFPDKEFLPLGNKIEVLRMVKTPDEIKKIKASQALAEAAFEDIIGFLSPERTEIEVAARLEYFMKKNGATAPSFETICVSGSRSSLPHGVPTASKLCRDSFVTLDFGCMLDGYASDMTRTVVIGKANEKMKFVYETVLSAQLAAISAIKGGIKGSEVDDAARSIIRKAGYANRFGHSTGHGVGLEVHEAPSFSPSYKWEIPAGAVLSVEPGIYIEGQFGVRIEDLIAVNESGCENLNSSSKQLLEIN